MLRSFALLALLVALASPVLAGDRARARVVVRAERAALLADLLVAADGRLVEPLAIPAIKAVVLEGRGEWANLDEHSLADRIASLAKSKKLPLTYVEASVVSRAEGSDCCGTEGPRAEDPAAAAKRAQQLGWPRRALGLDKVTTADARGTLVALLDTGIDSKHPALAESIVEAESLLDEDRDPSDKNGHGTAVAGVIVAKGNREDQLAPRGIATGAKLLSIKIMDDRGTGDLVTLARGIVRAADKNARVVLVSAGVAAPSAVLEDAVRYARSRGSIVVAAAGNETLCRALYPARTPGAVGVAASRDGHRLSLNTPLDGAIELAAPGDEVLTTLPTAIGGKGVMGGSSMSAAYVAGTAALAFGTGAGPDEVLRVVRGARHAFPLLAPHARFLTIGELDAALALARLDSAVRTIDSVHAFPMVARPGTTLDVRVRVRASGGRVAAGGSLVVNGVSVALPALPSDGSPVEVSVKVTAPEEGQLVAKLDEDTKTIFLPVARGAKVSKLQVVDMTLGEVLRVTVENQGETAEEVSVAALAEKDFLRGEAARRVEAGASATFVFALPVTLPEVCRFEARVNEVAAFGRLDVRIAGKDPRPVRPLYQQSGDVDLVADAPWRLEPDRTYLPVMLFAPSKGDSGRGIDLAIDSANVYSLDKPNATSGGQLYSHVRGAAATATPGTELLDEDGVRMPSNDLFANKVLPYNGAYNVFRFPRAAFGVQLRPGAPVMRFVDVRLTWTAHRSAFFGLTVATDKGTYKKVLGVNFAARALPVLPGEGRYYDTHVHTVAEWYITSPYDLLAPKKAYGGPVTMIREAAYALGITSQVDPGEGRIITTDHSCFRNEQDPKANTEARRIQVGPTSPARSMDPTGRVKTQTERYQELFGLSANEEVAFDQPKKILVVGIPLGAHMLSFRGPHWEENWNGSDGGGSPNNRAFGKGALALGEILSTLAEKAPDQHKDAFLYSAHPFSSQGWNDESLDAGLELKPTATGRRTGKTINPKTNNFVMKGHQLWNGRTARELPSSKIDWYDLNPWVDTQWAKGHDNTAKAVETGLKTYHEHLSSLLRYENDVEPGRVFVRKLYVAAGSDAHGDFNYCEERLATPLNVSLTFGVSDNAFAKARTYVLEDGVPGQVERGMNALANGNSIVTDGPLAKLAFDANAHFDSHSLVYHAGAASFEDEDGRIGGGGQGPDGARTALVVAKSGDARWRYRYEDAPEAAVSLVELYKVEAGVKPKTRRIQPTGYDAPAPSATLPLQGAGKDNEAPAEALDKITAVQLGAFAGADPAKGKSPDAASRCYTNPVFIAPVKVDVIATPDSAAGKFKKGSITVRFTFATSMTPNVYAVEVKALDASGKTTDGSVAGARMVPANATGWTDDGQTKNAVFEVTNADEVTLAQHDWPKPNTATFVVYFRDAPQDSFGNELNRLATTFEGPRIGNPPAPNRGGNTTPASRTPNFGGGGGGGGCAVSVASSESSPAAIHPLLAFVALVVVARRRV